MAAASEGREALTIREMLLWLYGLGQTGQKVHKDQLEGYITGELCSQLKGKFKSPPDVSTAITKITNDAKTLIESVCNDAGKIIVGIQNGGNNTNTDSLKSELQNQPLLYKSSAKDLYAQFFYYLTCCYWQLRFLRQMCFVAQKNGGWTECQYGNGVQDTQCANGDHNNKRCEKCTKDKYKGCLQAFLTEMPNGDKKPPESPTKNIYTGAFYCPPSCKTHQNTVSQGSSQCPIPAMGFKKESFQKSSMKGDNVLRTNALDPYIDGKDKKFPKLLGKLLALQLLESTQSSSTTLKVPPTWGLPHLFAFWAVFMYKWIKNDQKFKGGWKKKFEEELKGNGATQYKWKQDPGNPESLLETLFKEHKGGDASQHKDDHNGITTLTNCDVKSDGSSSSTHCGKYFHGLLENAFDYVLGEFTDTGLFKDFMNHQTIKAFAEKFYDAFKKFKDALEKQTCVTGTNCTCIVFCDATHSCIYQHGLTLASPNSLNGNNNKGPKRKCNDLKEQLGHVLQNGAPLDKLTQLSKEEKTTVGTDSVSSSSSSSSSSLPAAAAAAAPAAASAATPETAAEAEPPPAPQAQTQQQSANGTASEGDKSSTGASTGALLSTFKNSFDGVLKQLTSTFTKVSKSAINTIGTTSQYILKEINAHHSSLLEPPCNVKECIDWLIRVGEMDHRRIENKKIASSHNNGPLQRNSSALASAIKKLTGSGRSFQNYITPLIKELSLFIGYNNGEISSTKNSPSGIATGSYHSAYSLTAKWPTCGTATGGAQCRGCKDNKCQCSTGASSNSGASPCDGTCCHRCDIRICAGIFIAMVPALDKALRELKESCDQKLKEEKKEKNGQKINDLKEHFSPLGYEDKDLNSDTKWNKGQSPQSKLNSAIDKLSEIKDGIKNAFENNDYKRNGFEAPENSTAGATTVPSVTSAPCATVCSTPRTIREMLLWLMGLPYCEGYKQFVDELQKKFKEHNKNPSYSRTSTAVSTADYHLHRQYSAVIFQFPVLFYALEGTVSYLRDTFCQFTGDDKNCTTGTHTHCTTGTDTHCTTGTNKNCTVSRFRYDTCGCCLLRTFCAIVAVLYPVQRFLLKRCEAPARAAERRTTRRSAQTTAPERDCCSPCPSELDDWSQLCVKGPSRDCKQGTECKDQNCCKDKKGSTPCNTSTLTVIRPACQCRALYDFVCFMGFRVGAKVAVRGTVFHDVLRDCFGEQDEEDNGSESGSRPAPARSKNNPYVKLASCWRLSRCVLRSHCQKGEDQECTAACSSKCCVHCSQDNALSSSSCSPSTIRQMMLWLIGLPLTEAYKKDQDTAQRSAVSSLSSPAHLFGSDGCVSEGVQCIPPLKKLEENNKAQQRAHTKGLQRESLKPTDLFKSYYKETIVWMLVVFNAIEGSLTSVLCYLRDHAPGTGASRGVSQCAVGQKEASSCRVCSRLTYEFKDPSKLLGTFCRYIYKVHFQLRFLLTMCTTPKADGGWSQCIYSNRGFATVTGGVCRCLKDINIPCNNSPLRHFLNSTDKKNKFKLCDDKNTEHLQMGFTVRECSSSLTGAHIATVLEALIDPIHTSSSTAFTRPLSLLTQYCVAIGQLEPASLGDLFTVFGELGVNTMWTTMYLYGQEGQRFSRTLLCELWGLFKCCSEGCKEACDKNNEHNCSNSSNDCQDSNKDCAWRYCLELSKSISSVMAPHNDPNGSQAPTDPCNDSHRYSLSSLMCSGTTYTGVSSTSSVTATSSPASPHCAPYLKSLSQGLYTYYCPTVKYEQDKFNLLQWLYDRLRQLLDGMKELRKAFEKCKCCQKGTDSKASCQSLCCDIVSCPYAHPTIYRFGFMLGSPEALKGSNNGENCKGQGKKNCLSFLQQLGCVLRAPEGCQKKECNVLCCQKERGVLCSQQGSVPSQDASPPSPCVPTSPVGALYLAFECVIDIVYRIMLKRALLRVQCVVQEWYNNKECEDKQQEKDCSSQKDNENALQCQLIGAFSLYVTNAMYCSYPRLICTFACQVFKENGNSVCDASRVSSVSHASRVPHSPCVHRAPGPRITTAMCHSRGCCKPEQCFSTCKDSNASLCISKSALTSITPIIPQYCPTAIDRYHYRALKKATTTVSDGTSSCATSYYSFQSALDFHVQGTQCILPVPSNLRSAVDWILRVSRGAIATGATATQGDKQNNDCDKLCQKKDCADGQRGDPSCDPEVVIFQCLAQEISRVLNGDQKDAEKKQCDQKDSDALSTRNVSFTVSQCQECNALSTCNTSSNTCAQCLLRNLAQGLRTFVGYKDMTQEVKGEVLKERNTVRKEICSLLECLKGFMCNNGVSSSATSSKCSLSAELGNALLKGRYEIKGEPLRDILEAFLEHYDILTGYTENLKGAPFTDVLCIFSRALTSEHKQCDSDLRCNTLRDCNKDCKKLCETTTADTSTKNNCLPQGLSQLCEFFQGIQRFSCEWDHIGKKGSASKGSEAEECKKRGEQLQCCSKYCTQPCSSSCSKVCHFAPSSDVVFNERQKAECLGWTFNGQKKDECDKKDCPQDWPCKGPNKDCSTSLSSSSSSSPSCPRGFFQQLQCGLHVLGQCAQKVSALSQIGNNSVTSGATAGAAQCNTGTNNDSQCHITQYKAKICALIQALKRFGDHIEGCKFEGAPEGSKERCQKKEEECALTCNALCQDSVSQSNEPSVQCSASCCSCRADASYAVDGAKKLMEETKKGVEKKITGEMKKGIEKAYAAAYGWDNDDLRISNCNAFVKIAIAQKLDLYKSHLDDLKRLCQWLYRMGQLYASGLKGFVESLVSHLEHIVQVIDWITGIERMMTRFGMECVSNARELIDRKVLECIPVCCDRHKRSVPSEASVSKALCEQKATCTNRTVTASSSSGTGSDTCVLSPSVFFDALNCRIDNLLSSYVLGPLPKGAITQNDSACSQGQNSQGESSVAPGATPSASDRSCLFRQFLERLRLLALDRYTLQLWQDESCTTNRVSSIRHWNVFEGGIVKHSDLEGIKRALGCLTQMEDYKDIRDLKGVRSSSDCSSSSPADSSNASSTAPPSASRSRIHDFHAICVLQKFSFEAPLRALQCSIKGLKKIKGCLQGCEQELQPLQKLLKKCDCNSRGVNSCKDQCLKALLKECSKALSQDGSTATPFCEMYRFLCEFLNEKYGVYSLAQFLHTILGPNAFSAVICSLRDLKEILCAVLQCSDTLCSESNKESQDCKLSVPSNKDSCCPCRLMRRMSSIVSILNGRNHLRTPKDTVKCTVSCVQRHVNDDCYSLASFTNRLQDFVDVLKREYIFCYPVVCGIELEKDCNAVCPGECDTECDRKSSVQCSVQPKDTSLACSSQSSLTRSHTSATSTVSLTSPLPLLCAHCHVSASICPQCIPLLSHIFITLVPVLYPQLCYLAYQCRLYWQQDQMNGYRDSALHSLLHTFGWATECLNRDIYIDVRFIGHHVYWLLTKTENTLQLLCQDFTEALSCSPFNKNSPLFKLYHLCLAYYQHRRSQGLTDPKSTTAVMPTSLREILRFFVYLPFSAQFQSLQEVLRSYCSQSCVVSFSDLFATLMMSSAMSAVLLQLIECPQGEFLRFFDDIYTNKDGLYFGSNTETLFYQVCDLSVTLYRGLKFLSLQCGTGASLAGWKDCRLRGVKKDTHSKDSRALDTRQLQLCASHLCECQSIGAKDSSTTCSVLTSATPMCLNSDSSVSTQPSHTTCSLPLLRYVTDADCFFDSTPTVQSALRKVCLNDSCQEMVYRHMAPRGWQKERLQCTHRDEQKRVSQLEVCNEKACYSACHSRDCDRKSCDPLDSNCRVSCCHHCCRAQCCAPVCSRVTGASLFQVLRNFVGHEHDADPLLQFTRSMVAIAAWPPDSLSGYMTFMLRFSDQLRKEERDTQGSVSVGSAAQKNTSQENDSYSSVLSSLKSEITLFPGEFNPNCLIDAFLRVTHCDHNNGVTHTALPSSSTATSSSPQCPTSSGATISMLSDCQQCERLLRPLDYDVYDLYLPMYARRYLTWMLHFGPRLHRGMRALEKEFKRHIKERSVVQSGVSATDPVTSHSVTSQSRTSVPCHASVLQCQFALPELHSAGLHFWAPEKMCSVSCQCVLQRLHCTLQECSVFAEFLRQCDSFLWSVRKPFYWLTMALWIIATVYLLFVHFWRLDSWRLLSHVIRSRASHLVYPKVLIAAEQSYERYYAPR